MPARSAWSPGTGHAVTPARPGGAGHGAPPPLTQTFPATADRVGQARRFLAGLLDGCPAAGDAVLCLSELASNSVLHSSSGRPGGRFTVRVSLHHDRVRVEVEDEGGPWLPAGRRPAGGPDGALHHPGPADPRGRGLAIVAELSRDWGISGDGQSNRVVWFECGRP